MTAFPSASPPRSLALLVAFASVVAAARIAGAQDDGRGKQIADVEAEIRQLQSQLKELRGKAAGVEAKVAASPVRPVEVESWLKSLTWRCIGPANMGGRIVAISVFEKDPSLYYVATASGGLLKTTNNGITFEHQFDRESTVSIGDVCVAPSDPNIVWVGTGEANARNSVSYGDGAYKSTDGGKTWKKMGLEGSYQIGKVLIHPTNPDIVYVGALGRLFGPSDERGLFKTVDGGKTWDKVLFVDDKTGIIDLRMHPTEPDTLIAATYERRRGLYDEGDPEVKFGSGAGLHKTTDGGKTWTRLTRGLPTVKVGRIGLDWYRKDPKVVFAIIESEKIGTGTPPPGGNTAYMGINGENGPESARLTGVLTNGPAQKAGLQDDDLVIAIDDKPIKSYAELTTQIRAHKPDDKVKVQVRRGDETKTVELTFGRRSADGVDPQRPYGVSLGGQRENVQDRQGPDGFQTGGVYKSTDGGESWSRINSLNPRPFYFSQVRVDPSDDKYLYVLGIALYRSDDGGKTFKSDGGRGVHADQHALWIDPKDGRHMVLGCDGGLYVSYDRMDRWDHLNHLALAQFYDVAVDTNRDYRVFGGLQDNGTWGGPSRVRNDDGPVNEDWIRVNGSDGFQAVVDPEDADLVYATAQYGRMIRRDLRTGALTAIRPQPEKGQTLRFNWNTPFLLSHHNPRIFYCAANYVYRSLDRGEDLKRISPELTHTAKGSATALAESPLNPDLLYAGTDDGAVWVTRDGGREWTDISKKLAVPRPMHVASIEASRFAEGRAYIAFNGRRSDDDAPWLFVTEDHGQTWKRLGAELPRGSTYCLREDISNPDLLFAGTEFALWTSLDRGKVWHKLNNNLPTVAVHDAALHPTAGELVAATHGRSLWVLDIAALRQIKSETLTGPAALFRPTSAIRWLNAPARGRTNRRYVGENPASGAPIYYAINGKPKKVELRVLDPEGKTIRTLRPRTEPGLHRVAWDLTRTAERPASNLPGVAGAAATAIRERVAANLPGRPVPPGVYRVVLEVDGESYSQPIRVEFDPALPPTEIVEDEEPIGGAEEEEEDELELEGALSGPIFD